jgi:hypothetical protein
VQCGGGRHLLHVRDPCLIPRQEEARWRGAQWLWRHKRPSGILHQERRVVTEHTNARARARGRSCALQQEARGAAAPRRRVCSSRRRKVGVRDDSVVAYVAELDVVEKDRGGGAVQRDCAAVGAGIDVGDGGVVGTSYTIRS